MYSNNKFVSYYFSDSEQNVNAFMRMFFFLNYFSDRRSFHRCQLLFLRLEIISTIDQGRVETVL